MGKNYIDIYSQYGDEFDERVESGMQPILRKRPNKDEEARNKGRKRNHRNKKKELEV